MKKIMFPPFQQALGLALGLLLTGVAAAQAARYDWVNLVSDIPGVARYTDANLQNPWGLASRPEGDLWVADNDTGVSTVYARAGHPLPLHAPLVVTVPPVASSTNTVSAPTGIVLNYLSFTSAGDHSFVVTNGAKSGPCEWLFCTEDGSVGGYSKAVGGSAAIIPPVFSASTTAIYKGIAISYAGTKQQLYLANFAGGVEVYSNAFARIAPPGGFVDPYAASGFKPFNIKHVALVSPATGKVHRFLFVTYAKPDPATNGREDLRGAGNGYINAFDPEGNFKGSIVAYSGTPGNGLNSPWGMAIAHHSEAGRFHATLFAGNVGSGLIRTYGLTLKSNGTVAATATGELVDTEDQPLRFQRLWALHFAHLPERATDYSKGIDELNEDDSGLYFTAGIAGENHGLVGRIVKQ